MDWTTYVAGLVTGLVIAVLGKVVADWWTDRRHAKEQRSAAAEKFDQVVAAMPALLQEMSADVRNNSLIRVFVALPSPHVAFNYPTKHGEYYEKAHEDLPGKIAMLENLGYVYVERGGDFPIYRMTEEFVALLTERLPQSLPSA
jgi:hypothetical protein